MIARDWSQVEGAKSDIITHESFQDGKLVKKRLSALKKYMYFKMIDNNMGDLGKMGHIALVTQF